MNRFTRHVITAGTVSVAASLGIAAPAAAAPAKPTCYKQPLEHLDVAQPTQGLMTTDLTLVATGSPCRDINVRNVVDTDGHSTCRTLRVNWVTEHKVGAWKKVCTRWAVLASRAPEGAVYVIEGKGRPASVAVRS